MYKQVFDSDGNHVGTFDGEFVYSIYGELCYRIDAGDEVYLAGVPGKYVGTLSGNEARRIDNSILFRLME